MKVSFLLDGLFYLKHVVEPSKGLDEHVGSLVSELITTRDEEIEGAINVEVQVSEHLKSHEDQLTRKLLRQLPIEVSTDKLVNFLFINSVEILKLMKSRELFDIQPVWSNDIRFSLEEVLSF